MIRNIVPTSQECATIRSIAHKAAQSPRVVIEPVLRTLVDSERPPVMNISVFGPAVTMGDTEMVDFRTWAAFRNGFPPGPGGAAIVDFAVSVPGSRYADRELRTHVQAYFEAGRLNKIKEQGTLLWSKEIAGA